MTALDPELQDLPFVAGEDAVLHVEHLTKRFGRTSRWSRSSRTVTAVDDVSFDLRRGETLGLVGESGCGKTTLSRMLLRLIEPTSGSVVVDGQEVTGLGGADLRRFRQRAQVVFQDPYASLDPRQRIAATIAEPLTSSSKTRAEKQEIVTGLMERMGLLPGHAHQFPHQFSGGQRQRIGIARALSVTPQLLILDEPVSALDVSIQAQVLSLLQDLRSEFDLSYILISHDLSVVRHVSDRVMVMYLGRLVEVADKRDLFTAPRHPYTVSLLSAAPVPDPAVERTRERIVLRGDPPNPANPPSGCAFHRRCFHATAIASGMSDGEVTQLDDGSRVPTACVSTVPLLAPQGSGHWSACHFPVTDAAAAGVTSAL
ncbi:ABC transporter ATP-binding protein [Nocardioides nitrophenolicus]|uniref:ABC transporter ATP-binding protein n=1 Tax=Nocardioides nitrophenolicus TaxID=60489 RepID=UPI00195DC009|nr:oligopeptide/dipeptide ABC transporter ATP-binding protein [Nocardioides nitrophenolicus]MBM7518751.1 oligopeptide/dipeptide ABC transporter ATP-binding protein [Nocardioides nitrophenolicus]